MQIVFRDFKNDLGLYGGRHFNYNLEDISSKFSFLFCQFFLIEVTLVKNRS